MNNPTQSTADRYLAYHIPTLERSGLPEGSYQYKLVKDPYGMTVVAVTPKSPISVKVKKSLELYKYTEFIDDKNNTIYLSPGKVTGGNPAIPLKEAVIPPLDSVDMNPVQPKAKMIADPASFKEFVGNLKIEPVEKVKERFLTKRSDPAYVNSRRYANDLHRLFLELDDIKSRNELSDLFKSINLNIAKVFSLTSPMARKEYGEGNVIDFYEKSLKGGARLAAVEETLIKIAANLYNSPKYFSRLDEINYRLGIGPRNKLSKKLYDMSYRLPRDKYSGYADRLKKLAATLNNPTIR